MSKGPEPRRDDKEMSQTECWALVEGSYCGRVATTSADGQPYITPLLHVVLDAAIWVYTTSAQGHLARNIGQVCQACFEVDRPGAVHPNGRFQWDTGLSYASVLAFGELAPVRQVANRARFFDALMAKYANEGWRRPASFYPHIDHVTVFRLSVERLSGKVSRLPEAQDLWARRDRTMTLGAALHGE